MLASTATQASATRTASRERTSFYFWIAVAMAATGFIGFMPTFWLPMIRGAFTSPVITIHAFVSSAWLLLFVLQTWLVASGRTARHRDMGLLGVATATGLLIFAVMAAINQTQRAAAAGDLEAGLRFMVLPIAQASLFALLVVAAMICIHRPDWHRRLLVVATAMLMDGPVGRFLLFFFVFHRHMPVPAGMPSPPPPVDSGYPLGLLLDIFFFIPIAYDWRTRGFPHPAYLVGYGAVVLMRLLRPALSLTQTWHAVAVWILSLAK
ncbi:MAG: hypothetical protein ACM36C_04310 [Acidobacteriota bacterium]